MRVEVKSGEIGKNGHCSRGIVCLIQQFAYLRTALECASHQNPCSCKEKMKTVKPIRTHLLSLMVKYDSCRVLQTEFLIYQRTSGGRFMSHARQLERLLDRVSFDHIFHTTTFSGISIFHCSVSRILCQDERNHCLPFSYIVNAK